MSDDEFNQKFSSMLEKFDDDFDSPENIARITKNVVRLSKQDRRMVLNTLKGSRALDLNTYIKKNGQTRLFGLL